MTNVPRRTILLGDAHKRLAELPPESVDCVVTSPPYYALRDYGVDGQIGLEPNVEAWVAALMVVVRDIGRVLRKTGSLWLNLGDSYSRHPKYGAPPKGLLLGPERVALAAANEGWIVRNKVIYAKKNPMPHSVSDRLNTTYEVVYFLVRDPRYWFDLDAIRERHLSRGGRDEKPRPKEVPVWAGPLAGGSQAGLLRSRPFGQPGHLLGKNPGDVWHIATRGYRGAHFATFPPLLVERPLLATCPERVCEGCGRPWRRRATVSVIGGVSQPERRDKYVRRYPRRWETVRRLGRLEPQCGCTSRVRPGLVLDPFFGTGTVGVVAERHGRDWTGIELNPTYVRLAKERLRAARSSPERLDAAA